ncbi:MAG: hypothetical protein U1C51_09435 [Candidatus Izemoplasmatales bacterium]|jgi:hypothetical protein|nr:hypothetical protein [bacterium]MDZ4197450.1 hypothetical protein [Candidatus Izemoplasmatales bacterium]
MSKDDLKAERLKILDLLHKGIIKVEDAERLLAALGASKAETNENTVELITNKKAPFRMLKVYVDSADGDQVRIQLPIEFAKLLKTSKFNIDAIEDMDIDIDMLIQMINSGAIGEIVNVTSADGDIVRITVE